MRRLRWSSLVSALRTGQARRGWGSRTWAFISLRYVPTRPPSQPLVARRYTADWLLALSAPESLSLPNSLGVCARVALCQIVMKNIIPVVMAGVLGIYGLIIAVIIGNAVKPIAGVGGTYSDYSAFTAFAHFSAGLCCGMSGLVAGIAIGIVGDAGVRSVAQQPKMYVGMVLILIFAEALGLYGLIVGLILASNTSSDCGVAI